MKPEVVPYHGGPKEGGGYVVPKGMSPPPEIRIAGQGCYALKDTGYEWRANR